MAGDILYVKLEPALKGRIMHQCDRLGSTQAALTKMALVRFLEEEEGLERVNSNRGVVSNRR